MTRERFKRVIVWLALTFVLALPLAATFTPPVSAQGHYRRYDQRARYYRRGHPYPGYRYRPGYYPKRRYGHPYRYHHR
jgi:hypothetical protein